MEDSRKTIFARNLEAARRIIQQMREETKANERLIMQSDTAILASQRSLQNHAEC